MKVDIAKVKTILELVKEHTDDVTIDVSEDGIVFSLKGSGGVTMVRGKLLPTFFAEWPTDIEDMELSFSATSLLDALKGIKGEATMSYDAVTCDILITAGRVRKSFRVDGGESQTMSKPNITYTTEVELDHSMVKEITEVLKSVDSKGAKATTITLDDFNLRFTIPGKTLCEWVAPRSEIKTEGKAKSNYDTSFLICAMSSVKMSDTVKLFFSDDYPLMTVVMDTADAEESTMLIQQIVAPRIGDYDE